MSTIETLRDYSQKCPAIKGDIHIDWLSDEPIKYMVEAVPCDPIVTRFLDGSSDCKFLFVLAVRCPWNDDAFQNSENAQLCEDLENWIDKQNESGNLPVLPNSKQSTGIRTLTGGYIMDTTKKSAV